MNRKEEIYNLWAPARARWSPWVKPVLFAHLRVHADGASSDSLPESNAHAVPAAEGDVALLVDVPGTMGVAMALAADRAGYQAVVLYNAPPGEGGSQSAAVDMRPVMDALVGGADRLLVRDVAIDRPPAFILDSRRLSRTPEGTVFDNRSRCFATDFTSASALQSAGIHRVLLIQQRMRQPAPDLMDTMAAWHEAGIETLCAGLAWRQHHPVNFMPGWFGKLQMSFLVWWRDVQFMSVDAGSSS